jgi:hypothetical protein
MENENKNLFWTKFQGWEASFFGTWFFLILNKNWSEKLFIYFFIISDFYLITKKAKLISYFIFACLISTLQSPPFEVQRLSVLITHLSLCLLSDDFLVKDFLHSQRNNFSFVWVRAWSFRESFLVKASPQLEKFEKNW